MPPYFEFDRPRHLDGFGKYHKALETGTIPEDLTVPGKPYRLVQYRPGNWALLTFSIDDTTKHIGTIFPASAQLRGEEVRSAYSAIKDFLTNENGRK